jgi:hypothetical protein
MKIRPPKELIKLRNETLKSNGKYSIKRMGVISSFYIAMMYAFMPIWFPMFVVHEFVFWGFITFAGAGLGMTVWNKKIAKQNPNNELNEN